MCKHKYRETTRKQPTVLYGALLATGSRKDMGSVQDATGHREWVFLVKGLH